MDIAITNIVIAEVDCIAPNSGILVISRILDASGWLGIDICHSRNKYQSASSCKRQE